MNLSGWQMKRENNEVRFYFFLPLITVVLGGKVQRKIQTTNHPVTQRLLCPFEYFEGQVSSRDQTCKRFVGGEGDAEHEKS